MIPGGSYLPDFNFVWRNKADTTNTYVFVTDQNGVRTGNLTPDSFELRNGATSKLSGTFSDRNITMTILRASGSVTATGGFTDDDTIGLKFGNTIVTLIRIRQ